MTHPLRPREASSWHVADLGYAQGIAAVMVRRRGTNVLVVQASLFVLKPDTEVARIPASIRVVDEEGEPIQASGEFWISIATFDPYHAVCDVDPRRTR